MARKKFIANRIVKKPALIITVDFVDEDNWVE